MSHPYDLVLLAPRVVTPAGETAAAVGVRGEQITAVEAYDSGVVDGMEPDRVVRLAEDEVLLPGLVDTHVHVNDPGRTEWEGFHSATRAAAAGGVTTIVDMPLNSIPPTCTVEALTTKRAAAEGQCFVDVGFWGGAIPGNLKDLRGLHDAGVFGFKAFLLDSGVEEFPPLSHDGLDAAMRELASFGATMIVHAEDAATVAHADEPRGGAYASFLASRPAEAEDTAVAEVIDLARRTGCRAHILHLSSAEAMETIRSARTGAVEVTAETCPHYLTLAAEEIADGATQYKCCPPIRGAENRDALWSGLADGTIDFVVSDHSPSTVDLKQPDHGDFGTAWGGISSVQLGLPAVWTEARRRGHTLAEVAGWMATGPAALAGLRGKGRIAVGYDADLCVLAPDEELVVDPARLFHKNPVTAYAGRRLTGRVRGIWLRGRHITPEVEQDGHPRGRLLTRT